MTTLLTPGRPALAPRRRGVTTGGRRTSTSLGTERRLAGAASSPWRMPMIELTTVFSSSSVMPTMPLISLVRSLVRPTQSTSRALGLGKVDAARQPGREGRYSLVDGRREVTRPSLGRVGLANDRDGDVGKVNSDTDVGGGDRLDGGGGAKGEGGKSREEEERAHYE
jgi:hypothetical protein